MSRFFQFLFLSLSFCAAQNSFSASTHSNNNKRYEIPSYGSTATIIDRKTLILSFNNDTRVCNWVAWSLTATQEKAKVAERKNIQFVADPLLKKSSQVNYYDYSRSGYSRGHMAPAADMRYSWDAMNNCFFLSNVCPQLACINTGVWSKIEKKCRHWAVEEEKVYVCCGPIFRSSRYTRIGKNHKMAVPDAFFKVILSLRPGHEKAIGFIVENCGNEQTLSSTVCSVDKVERITHFDFFHLLPDDLEQRVEASYNVCDWPDFDTSPYARRSKTYRKKSTVRYNYY